MQKGSGRSAAGSWSLREGGEIETSAADEKWADGAAAKRVRGPARGGTKKSRNNGMTRCNPGTIQGLLEAFKEILRIGLGP